MDPKALYEQIADDLCAQNDDVEEAKMMGMPCLKRNGKMFAGYFTRGGAQAMTFKLPDEADRANALALDGAQLFDPSGQGRPFKEWVQVPAEHRERWPDLATQALRHPAG